jgi:hypothetical protein
LFHNGTLLGGLGMPKFTPEEVKAWQTLVSQQQEMAAELGITLLDLQLIAAAYYLAEILHLGIPIRGLIGPFKLPEEGEEWKDDDNSGNDPTGWGDVH